MESELSFALRNVLSIFDLLTYSEKWELIEELKSRAGEAPAKPLTD